MSGRGGGEGQGRKDPAETQGSARARSVAGLRGAARGCAVLFGAVRSCVRLCGTAQRGAALRFIAQGRSVPMRHQHWHWIRGVKLKY
jgi:hypothetical protein